MSVSRARLSLAMNLSRETRCLQAEAITFASSYSYGIRTETRHTHRARRGRPAKTASPPTESGYCVVVEVEGLSHPEEDNGWTVLATTVVRSKYSTSTFSKHMVLGV